MFIYFSLMTKPYRCWTFPIHAFRSRNWSALHAVTYCPYPPSLLSSYPVTPPLPAFPRAAALHSKQPIKWRRRWLETGDENGWGLPRKGVESRFLGGAGGGSLTQINSAGTLFGGGGIAGHSARWIMNRYLRARDENGEREIGGRVGGTRKKSDTVEGWVVGTQKG